MNIAINLLSVVPVRKEASHRSEMVSQLVFGDYVELLEEEKEFAKVKCLYDGYEGWVQLAQLTTTDEVLQTDRFTGRWVEEVRVNGIGVKVPFGTPVYHKGQETLCFGKAEVQYVPDAQSFWPVGEAKMSPESLKKAWQPFLSTPYLWGGRSVFGIDCSGFAQQVFKLFGIKLLRDAYLQAEEGLPLSSIAEAGTGDLAFFHNENGRVVHVGIVLEKNEIVHASGKVRIDTLDEEGILSRETGKRTHRLHSIRRYF